MKIALLVLKSPVQVDITFMYHTHAVSFTHISQREWHLTSSGLNAHSLGYTYAHHEKAQGARGVRWYVPSRF